MDGNELRRRRMALGYSQTDLAYILGVPRNTVSRWELGSSRILHPDILDLAIYAIEVKKAAALGVEPRQLLKASVE